MKRQRSPYDAHLFICVKSRGGERKSCGDGGNPDLKAVLKDAVKARGWKPRIRVSDSGCLGVCDAGPNIMIHPQRIWLSEVTLDDVPAILALLEEIINK